MYCDCFSRARYTFPNLPRPSGLPMSKSVSVHCFTGGGAGAGVGQAGRAWREDGPAAAPPASPPRPLLALPGAPAPAAPLVARSGARPEAAGLPSALGWRAAASFSCADGRRSERDARRARRACLRAAQTHHGASRRAREDRGAHCWMEPLRARRGRPNLRPGSAPHKRVRCALAAAAAPFIYALHPVLEWAPRNSGRAPLASPPGVFREAPAVRPLAPSRPRLRLRQRRGAARGGPPSGQAVGSSALRRRAPSCAGLQRAGDWRAAAMQRIATVQPSFGGP